YNGAPTTPTSAGSYTVIAMVSDANYQGSSTGTLMIAKATPVITWTVPTAVYTGSTLGSAQLNATTSIPGSFSYTPAAGTQLNTTGNQQLEATFTPTDSVNYATATAGVTLVVNSKLIPAITWATPAAISYGTPLSATQLNATTSVPGSFSYTPAAGTVLDAGTQTVTATFTPTDTVTYASSTAGVTITINKASAAITLDSATLNQTYSASAKAVTATTIPGGLNVNFSYNNSATAPAAAGSYPVVATISDANYTGSATGTLTIASAAQVIAFNPPASAIYGDDPITLNATSDSGLPVAFNVVSGPGSLNGNTLTIIGAGNIVVKASQAGNTNHAAAADVQATIAVVINTSVDTGTDGLIKVPVTVTSDDSQISIAKETILLDDSNQPVSGPLTMASAMQTLASLQSSPAFKAAFEGQDESGNSLVGLAASIDISLTAGSGASARKVKKFSKAMKVKIRLTNTLSKTYNDGDTADYYSFNGANWAFEDSATAYADNGGIYIDMSVPHLSLWGVPLFKKLPSGKIAGDGVTAVTIADALRALHIAVGLIAPTENDLANGDVAPLENGKPKLVRKGAINVGDAIIILQKSLGIVNSW
ncbi:MAG: hypothetical protein HYV06_06145, partial [Deltaproteobacteria bacterium]|nr:hypothetical protein [Deltaproteobacteria bacterium]